MPKLSRPFLLTSLLAALFGAMAPAPATAQRAAPVTAPDFLVEGLEAIPPAPRLAAAHHLPPMASLRTAEEGARDSLDALHAWNAAGRLPTQTGFTRPLPGAPRVRLTMAEAPTGGEIRLHAGGLLAKTPAGGLAWSTRVEAQGARRLRLHLTGVQLPAETRFWVYGSGEEPRAFGLELLAPDGSLWTPSIGGPALLFELEIPASSPAMDFGFELPELLESRFDPAPSSAELGECIVDGSCVSTGSVSFIDPYRKAVALLSFIDGGDEFICTGGLVTDAINSLTPYLLTANHCFDRQSSASTLEAFWDYRTPGCNGSTPNLNALPRSNGSTLLATGAASDFTFVRLSNVPAGRTFLGWDASASAVPNGTVLHRLSHPAPEDSIFPQAYSRSSVRTSGVPLCGGSPRPQFLYAQMSQGGTFGGSSGSPVLKSGGFIVGQLSGGCGPDAEDGCNYANSEFDGAFSATYPALAQWLNPATTGSCAEDADTLCLSNGRFRVEATWTTPQGASDTGKKVRLTSDTGYFWFFSSSNVEAVVKVLNACSLNNRYWVFAGGLTSVRVVLQVTDTKTGQQRTYTNPQGAAFQPVQDTNAFSTCP